MVVGVACVLFVALTLGHDWRPASSALSKANLWYLVPALGTAVVAMVLMAWRWAAAIAALDSEKPSVRRITAGFFVGELAKYVPGGVWSIYGRGEIGKREGLSRATAYASVALSLVACYLAAAVLCLCLALTLVISGHVKVPLWPVLLVVGLGSLMLHPAVHRRALSLLERIVRRQLEVKDLRWWRGATLAAWYLPTWVGIAGATVLVAHALSPRTDLVQVGFAAVAGWVIGFVSPAPGGIGVREAVFIAASGLPAGPAAAAAIVVRLIFVVIDVTGAVIGSTVLYQLSLRSAVSSVLAWRRSSLAGAGQARHGPTVALRPVRSQLVRRHPPPLRRMAMIGAVCLVVLGLGIGAHILAFYLRSSNANHALVNRYHDEASSAFGIPTGLCHSPPLSDSVAGPQALVEAKSIGLVAPVEGGDDDDVLNVAVGHVPGSVWPDQPGTTLLAAHDVSYFSQIDRLAVGDTLEFATPCDTYQFTVSSHAVVSAGSPLSTTPGQSQLVLETCYPLNALFISPQRYLVFARLTKVVVSRTPVPKAVAEPAAPTVPAPTELAEQGLTLDQNEVQLNVLELGGSPSSSWTQGPAPMTDEAAALADYFAGWRSAQQDQTQWWAALANVPFSDAQPMAGANLSYEGSLTPTLDVEGSSFVGASIDVDIEVTGGSDPGDYALQVTETVIGSELEITGWSLTKE